MEKLVAQVLFEEPLPERKPWRLSYFVTTDIWEEDGEQVTTYGICIDMDGPEKARRHIPSVSPDEEFVTGLVKRFAEQKLLPAHLEEVLYDLID